LNDHVVTYCFWNVPEGLAIVSSYLHHQYFEFFIYRCFINNFGKYLHGLSTAGNSREECHVAGKAYLLGAGPGDLDLLTVKALRVLQSADVVLHDALIEPAILGLASVRADIMNVGIV
jgi:hypothetical protein